MPERALAKIDALGYVVSTAESYINQGDVFPAIPAWHLDVTTHPMRSAIMAGQKRWNGTGWIDRVVTTPPLPLVASLSDRQLLEAIAKCLRVAQ